MNGTVHIFIFGAGYSAKALARAKESSGALPPPLAPPLKGEGKLPRPKSPSPLRGGTRGGGIPSETRSEVHLTGTTRSREKFAGLRETGIEPLLFDGALTADIAAALRQTTHLVISVAPGEAGDPVLAAAAAAIRQDMPALRWIGYLSSVGVYGDHSGAWVDEEAECRPISNRARLRLEAERQWLKAGAGRGVPVALLRLSGIYGPGRNAFVSLANGTARRLVKSGQVFNRVHVDDIAGALWHLAGPETGGIFNITDELPCPPQDVVAYAASVMGVQPPPEIPFESAQLSPMARSFYDENKRVSNAAIKREGYRFRFADYRAALDAMWAAGDW